MDRLRQITKIKGIHVINLKSRDERKKNIQKEMKKLKVKNYDIFPAIEGTYLEQEKLDKIDDEVLNMIIANQRQCFEQLPSFNAIGVLYSHLEVCKKISQGKESDIYLVLEDDAKFEDKFLEVLSNVWQMIPKDFDILMLGYKPVVQNEHEIIRVNQFLARYMHYWGMYGYIVSGKGAKIIVNNHEKVQFQYDAYVRSLIENDKLKSYFFLPPLINIMDKPNQKGSDVQTNQSPNLKVVKFSQTFSQLK